jgi:aryl-alcohol dehydrogenase-like predicted oxidoreductase
VAASTADPFQHACSTAAFDAGVNIFDNAEVYAGGRSEELMR